MRLQPKYVVSFDKIQRILRNHEIWQDPDSIVHRLPDHFKRRYWENVLRERTPVHWRPSTTRFKIDARGITTRTENHPVIPIYPPEADEGLWGGEGIVKGYRRSQPWKRKKTLPRNWMPTFWWPNLKRQVCYSEILDKYMDIMVTERTLCLIDKAGGFDNYILETPEIDLCSKLGCRLKREMLLSLARRDLYPDSEEKRNEMLAKYERFIIPESEAEWVGLDLNEAARKLQDLEREESVEPLKVTFERELVEQLRTAHVGTLPSDRAAPSFWQKLSPFSKEKR